MKFISHQKTKLSVFPICFLILAMGLSACTPKRNKDQLPAELNPFETEKVQLNPAIAKPLAIYPKGSKFAAVIYSECDMNDENSKEWLEQSANGFVEKSQHGVNRITLSKDLEMAQVKELSEKNDCIIGLSEDVKVKPTSSRIKLNQQPLFNDQWGIKHTNIESAYETFFHRYSGIKRDMTVTVGVVDEGPVSSDHPAYRGIILPGSVTSPEGGAHGNFVAGIAVAQANGSGMAGVMSSNVKLDYQVSLTGMIDATDYNRWYQILGERSETTDRIYTSAEVINISWALAPASGEIPLVASSYFRYYLNLLAKNNRVVVISGGNDGVNWTQEQNAGVSSSILIVGEQGDYSSPYSGSTYGTGVSIWAPGYAVMGPAGSSSYVYSGGTSTASPIVTGAAALAIGLFKTRTGKYDAALVAELIRTTGRTTPQLEARSSGKFLDLQGLANAINARHPPAQPPTPIAGFDEAYYLAQNPDVAAALENGSFISGYAHYIAAGCKEKRNPSADFDEKYYLDNNPDVKASVDSGGNQGCGFVHYINAGKSEGRRGRGISIAEITAILGIILE